MTCCKHSRNWLERQGWRLLFITHNIETHLIPLFSVQCLIAHSMLYMEYPRLEPFWINSIDNRKLVFNPGGRKLAMWLYGMGEGSLKLITSFLKKLSIVDLQGCISSRCTQQSVQQIYMYIYISDYFPV